MKGVRGGLLCLFVCLSLLFAGDWIQFPVDSAEEEEERGFYDFDLSPYLVLGDIFPVEASFEDPTVCTEKELDDAVFQILLARATFQEKSGKAERYNKVTAEVSFWRDEEELAEYRRASYDLVIGLRTSNPAENKLSEALLGARAGEERSVSYTYPQEDLGNDLAGEYVTIRAKVIKVWQQTIPELIDDVVREISDGAFETVADFRASVREDILEEKELEKAKAVWLAIADGATVKAYPERELEAYAALYRQNYENLAKEYDVSFSDLLSAYLGKDEEAFEEEALAFAREKVKNDMIFTQLVRTFSVTLSPEEYRAGVEKYYEDEAGDFSTVEDFIASYGEENLRRSLLWDKALKTAVDGAIQKGS